MKRIIASIAVFGLTALIAAYVALAPLAPRHGSMTVLVLLDGAAARLIAILGARTVVPGLLALGAVLSLLMAAILSFGTDAKPRVSGKGRAKAAKPEPGPVWRPEPLSEDRIAGLRRRAQGHADEEEAGPPPPRPVVLVRKPRERERDWFGDGSWLGGLPRLGEVEWPRDAAGTPLPFAAQVDLAEIGSACPESTLPRSGSLAFFLGSGAVVEVPPGRHEFTDPPADLPPAFDEGGYPFPPHANRLSRYFFPFWPVEPMVLDLPEALRDHREPGRDEAIEQAMAGLLSRHVPLRSAAFAAGGDTLWWHGISHLSDQLHEALEGAPRLVALQRESVRRAEETLDLFDGEGLEDDPAVEAARQDLLRERETLAAIEAQRDSLPDAITAVDAFAAGRDPWQTLTLEESAVVEELLAELHANFGDLVRYHVPRDVNGLATLSARAMITGAPQALAALPEDLLTHVNRDYRLPMLHQHQMFGLGACRQSAPDEHRRDILLLQLAYDDMMEWRWGEMGVFQFWISSGDAAAGTWHAARLTFACA